MQRAGFIHIHSGALNLLFQNKYYRRALHTPTHIQLMNDITTLIEFSKWLFSGCSYIVFVAKFILCDVDLNDP